MPWSTKFQAPAFGAPNPDAPPNFGKGKGGVKRNVPPAEQLVMPASDGLAGAIAIDQEADAPLGNNRCNRRRWCRHIGLASGVIQVAPLGVGHRV